MILCDIGNSNADFYQDGKMWSLSIDELKKASLNDKVYYINVNDRISSWLLTKKEWINLEEYFSFDTIYVGLGIDRIAACTTVTDGVVVDAGSAITVDVMSSGIHLGGFIVPGINAYEKAFASVSERLNVQFNPHVPLDTLPQKTNDALAYGVIQSIILLLEHTCKDKRIYFTGGDGKFFSTFFSNSIYDRTLIFRGMLKAIKESHLE